MYSSDRPFKQAIVTPNKDRMQKLRPWEIDVPTTPIGAHKTFGISSFGVRVLDFIYVKNASRASL
jgi:hypothetical protein